MKSLVEKAPETLDLLRRRALRDAAAGRITTAEAMDVLRSLEGVTKIIDKIKEGKDGHQA